MPDLQFRIMGVQPAFSCASPTLIFELDIEDTGRPPANIQCILLRCQIRIEPARRHYTPTEQAALRDLFGQPQEWGRTLRPMVWTHTSTIVNGFVGQTRAELPVACTLDSQAGATKYFEGLAGGEVPLCVLPAGTVFHQTAAGMIQAEPIPLHCEASLRMPVEAWRKVMAQSYSGARWVWLRPDLFEQLEFFRRQEGLSSGEQAIATLLERDRMRCASDEASRTREAVPL